MPKDLTIETIIYLQSKDDSEGHELATQIRNTDWRLVPTCQNCRHCSLSSNWCKLYNHNTKPSKQPECFKGSNDYLRLTKSLK